ncbi:UDP-3-O-acyl-N-acetylglucosamine deacetylase [Afifella pfennigii]|uniref:UDP-3-O-acyl-N-acetylglucosamine deacetylase n=1 Tax=Afifella pfennigii TaxID=209897 RepID=UPI00068E2DF9|nr:UDP-3-O-acyl-N-acetylglucosamine deacetylase [Afifella pfennigii]
MVYPWDGSQRTIRREAVLTGVGTHSGKPVTLRLCPADPGTGVVFLRRDGQGKEVAIPARSSALAGTELCTILGEPSGLSVATVEHLLAAVSALSIDNLFIEIDAGEVPVMDGSSEPFVGALEEAGIVAQKARVRAIKLVKPVRVEHGSSFAEFLPDTTRRFTVEIDFNCAVIGRQKTSLALTPQSFKREIARARTFGHMQDVEKLWAKGLALGSSLENAVVINDGKLLNAEGLRYPDEFVRHKLLDAIGDLALAGAPIIGHYRSYRGGHKINAMALQALLADRAAWSWYVAGEARPPHAEQSEALAGYCAPAFAPELS